MDLWIKPSSLILILYQQHYQVQFSTAVPVAWNRVGSPQPTMERCDTITGYYTVYLTAHTRVITADTLRYNTYNIMHLTYRTDC